MKHAACRVLNTLHAVLCNMPVEKTFQHFVSTPSNTKLPKFSRISESTSVKPSVTEGQAENQKH